SPPILLWLKYNTLTTGTREYRLKKSKGSGANQLKSQLILNNRTQLVDFAMGRYTDDHSIPSSILYAWKFSLSEKSLW
ncbi:unnamed protein product, partial [Rotaria sordida]